MAHEHGLDTHATHGHTNVHGAALHIDHGPRVLPASLSAPPIVAAWRTRALLVGAVGVVLSLFFLITPDGRDHFARALLLGWFLCFSLCAGGLCVLMLQYVSGGKWGLIIRRPLEAMTRTFWFVVALFIPIMLFGKKLYLWMAFPNRDAVENAVTHHLISEGEAHALNWKHLMLSPLSVTVQFIFVFAFIGLWSGLLNRWSLERDADPNAGSLASFEYWRIKSENLSGIGILLYSIALTIVAIDLIMSMDITWYSTMWGLQFLVGQGYIVLAVAIHTVIRLSRTQPFATALRVTEQHDLGKFLFGFVMLNIYLTFAQFLIIWSANSPEEIHFYLNRIRGGWWVICSLDFIFHWVVPFTLLLSRGFKRSRSKMLALTAFMVFARAFDLFWLIEPNFPKSMANFAGGGIGLLAYLTLPLGIMGLWSWFYLTELQQRPLVVVNDPHTAEILEPEHGH